MPIASLYEDLIDILGEAGLVALAENFGGTRLYVPLKIDENHEISLAIGIDPARALVARMAPDAIRVPLARELRAVRYRAQGASNAKIAVKLGLTESGINRIFQRLVEQGVAIDA